MKACLLALLGLSAVFAADEVQLALALKAQTDFDRVELTATPNLRDAEACVQSQAGLLPVTAPEELALLHYRKGYCTLVVGVLTNDQGGYTAAGEEFEKAIGAWPMRWPKANKKGPREPISSGLQVLAAITRLHANPDESAIAREIAEVSAAIQSAACNSNVMPVALCQDLLETGRQWQGWMAMRAGNLEEAAKDFAGSPASGWPAWVAGRKAFDDRKYKGAITSYTAAIDTWKSSHSFLRDLGPRPDMASALTELGGAQLLAGDTKPALATLDAAAKAGPAEARPLFLRGRAHELAGQMDQALSDYNMASRTAFAGAKDQASGEAHLYRGIVMYRRRDFGRAENEFASALNFEIPAGLRPDAVAWRQLAAVAGGSCTSAKDYLERSLAAVSPYFPLEEARSVAAGCATVQDNMASRSVNKVILLGHLGKDAETKFTPSGVAKSTFTIATNRRWKDQQSGEWKEETDWHNCVLWRAENTANYLQKGKQVYVEGRLQTRSYEQEGQKKYFTEVICDELILLGGRGDSGGAPGGDFERERPSGGPVSMPRSAQRPPAATPSAPTEDFNQGITDDDVPF